MNNRHQQQKSKSTTSMRLWKHSDAMKALPYFRSMTRSLRESWLDTQRLRGQGMRMDARTGGTER